MSRQPEPLEERFWRKVDKSGPNGCWVWLAGLDHYGYGQIQVGGLKGRKRKAHHVAWELIYQSPVPSGLQSCHKCDTRKCVNPDHIFFGTAMDNIHDMMAKGRRGNTALVGSKNHRAKLNEEQVLEVRRLCSEGAIPQRLIAEQFGVCLGMVEQIRGRRAWKHI